MADSTKSDLFAITAPGLERIAATELSALGIRAKAEKGGVAFRGGARDLYNANLHLRTASRVVVRLASFHASTFHELERRTRKIEWLSYLAPAMPVRLRVTCRKSRLYHSDAVAERIYSAIERGTGGVARADGDDHEDADDTSPSSESQLFIVRIVDDECEISIDSSGELLHRRGYRKEIAKAPLRETLAAAMILSSGWKKEQPLVDPMCGSGTIPIEAAMIARRIAPGRARRFAFMSWPDFDDRLWQEIRDAAESAVVPSGSTRIAGSDRDAGAIESARRNAERAGVAEDVQLSADAISVSLGKSMAASPGGWVLVNPPYGVRVGDAAGLRNLYATLGRTLSEGLGWALGILSADKDLARQTGLRLISTFATANGGIPVSFLTTGREGIKTLPDSPRVARARRGTPGQKKRRFPGKGVTPKPRPGS